MITTFLLLLLCFYLSYQIRKQQTTSSYEHKRQNTDNTKQVSTENVLKEIKLPRTRLRRHANFRQTRFIGRKVKRGVKLRKNMEGLPPVGKTKPVANFKRNPATKPRVIIKKHAMFRQKRFVQPRSKKQMGQTNGVVNDNKITKGHWLI